MTPEVRELVRQAKWCAMAMRMWGKPTTARSLDKAIAAVEALDDPATAHAAAIARRRAEDRDIEGSR